MHNPDHLLVEANHTLQDCHYCEGGEALEQAVEDVVEVSFLEVFKIKLDGVLSNLVKGKEELENRSS